MINPRQYVNDSLLITAELCEKYKGCGQGLAYMKRFYPNGFTVDDVYTKKARHIPMQFVCWGYHFLPFTDADKQKFLEYAKIVNSSAFILSHHIENCKRISESSYCENCSDVSNSENIIDSYDITRSKTVQESKHISNCNEVFDSQYCAYSDMVTISSYIHKSKSIDKSAFLSNCENVSNSFLLFGCNNVNNIIASKLSDTSNRIFCTEECPDDYDYAILNRKVSKNTFDFTFNRIKELIEDTPFADPTQLKFSYITARANMFKEILPIIYEIFPSMSKEDKIILWDVTYCSEILKEI